ncbi:MAG TPA: MoaD/ThiS family protein [Bacteroidia bacterium]
MNVRIKFFGLLAEVAKISELVLPGVKDTDAMREKIISDFPELKNQSFVVAVNKKVITGNQLLDQGDEIALLPPFAGG